MGVRMWVCAVADSATEDKLEVKKQTKFSFNRGNAVLMAL